MARQIDVKAKYALWVTPAEHDAMATVLHGCGGTVTAVTTTAAPPRTTDHQARTEDHDAGPAAASRRPRKPRNRPATSTTRTAPPSAPPAKHRCYRGEPGYRAGLDRDGDGVACE